MSDHYLRLIPTDPAWRRTPDLAEGARGAFASLMTGADEVTVEVHDSVQFVDQGQNWERLTCPNCQAELDQDWWGEEMDRASDGDFEDLAVTPPCCGTPTTLNDLTYVWPAGFARVVLSAINPGRGDWLAPEELTRVSTELGHSLRQVMTRV